MHLGKNGVYDLLVLAMAVVAALVHWEDSPG